MVILYIMSLSFVRTKANISIMKNNEHFSFQIRSDAISMSFFSYYYLCSSLDTEMRHHKNFFLGLWPQNDSCYKISKHVSLATWLTSHLKSSVNTFFWFDIFQWICHPFINESYEKNIWLYSSFNSWKDPCQNKNKRIIDHRSCWMQLNITQRLLKNFLGH